MEIVELVNNFATYLINIMSHLGPISGIVLIILESILPFLPLSVFIALNGASFGYVFGYIISWVSTCIGCLLSFLIFRKIFKNKFDKLLSKKNVKQIKKIKEKFSTITFSALVLIIALPFTPAFAVNIAAGLSDMSLRKFMIAILIGKLSITYFWTYIGKSLLESMMDFKTIITVALLLLGAYIISKLVSKKLKIE